MLFISWFLHQTTTANRPIPIASSCLSLDSYIKPQLSAVALRYTSVVYLLIPTSNHNCRIGSIGQCIVVYLLIPTSNHNFQDDGLDDILLFISWFLHQTTTSQAITSIPLSCLSLDSYIKPQPRPRLLFLQCVVYLLIPTSNHNRTSKSNHEHSLFISWFLHQTTT